MPQLQVGKQKLWGITTIISDVGAEIALTHAGNNLDTELPVTLEIMEEQLQLPVKIVKTGIKDEFATVRVALEQVSLSQHRRLVEILFCRPGQWQRQNTPGELRSRFADI